jgi:hypothetical protein
MPSLREMSTDRPDKTESPYTVDAGHFQFEADLVSFGYSAKMGLLPIGWFRARAAQRRGVGADADADRGRRHGAQLYRQLSRILCGA